MRAFFSFVARAVVTHGFTAAVGALLMGLGFTKTWLLSLANDPPWLLLHPLTAPVLVITGLLLVIWVAFEHSRIEIAIPEELKRPKYLRFYRIAHALAETDIGLNSEEILQRLLKALWMGEFESRSGKSRLVLPLSDGVRSTDIGPVPLTGTGSTSMGDHIARDADPNPRLQPFNRLLLLQALIPEDGAVGQVYPGLALVIKSNKTAPWRALKQMIKFELLGRLHPRAYPKDWRENYMHRLTMPRKDFVRWFARLRDGRYDKEPEWH